MFKFFFKFKFGNFHVIISLKYQKLDNNYVLIFKNLNYIKLYFLIIKFILLKYKIKNIKHKIILFKKKKYINKKYSIIIFMILIK